MKTASRLIWECHGSPVRSECVEHSGICWLCGGAMARGELASSWAAKSFTGHGRVRVPAATHVCEPCCFVCSRIAPVLGRPAKEGKKFGGSFRNYSHLWSESEGYANASKGEKPLIRDFLSRKHRGAWFAAIADSGQKHVIPFAPVNPPGTRRGVVLFDEQIVAVPGDQSLVKHTMDLLTSGATKEEILDGKYRQQTWLRCERSIQTFESAWSNERGSAWFGLAIWLAQRDEEAVKERLAQEKEERGRKAKRAAQNRNDRGAVGDKSRVPRKPKGKRAQELGGSTDPNARRDQDMREPGGVGNEHLPQPASASVEQLGLFGTD